MNRKLSEVLWKPIGIFKRNGNELNNSSTTDLVNDDDDDLGVNTVETRRNVPFKRMESAVRKFTDVALPIDLERLQKHKINIIRLRASGEFSKLKVEYENSSHTVKQISRNLSEMDVLRCRVHENELSLFDLYLTPAKRKAMEAISDFLTLKEGLVNIDNLTHSTAPDDAVGADHFEKRTTSKSSHRLQVTMQGNQLLVESAPDEPDSEIFDNTASNQMLVTDERPELTKSWKDLEKNITDLNEMMQTISSLVHEQGNTVDDISSNIEEAGVNIERGNRQLKKATVLKAAMFPIIGAAVGGPIGMVAGLKLGGIAIAAAGVTGSFVGYQGGKALKKRHEDANSFEMKPMPTRPHKDSDTSTGSFEMIQEDDEDSS